MQLCLPPEGGPHLLTWMAFGATLSAWGDEVDDPEDADITYSRPVARRDLIRIASNISRFETVHMLVDNMKDKEEAEHYLSEIKNQKRTVDQINKGKFIDNSGMIYIGSKNEKKYLPPIEKYPIHFIIQPINDLWTRDTGPVFVKDNNGRIYGVKLNFNGWGQQPTAVNANGFVRSKKKERHGIRRQDISKDQRVADFILSYSGVPPVNTWLTMEGGGIEVNGRGLAIAAESCILNDNRNPKATKEKIEAEFRILFGIEKMIWVRGAKGYDITDGHIDFIARFTSVSHIVYSFHPKLEYEDEKLFKAGVAEINNLDLDLKAKYLGSRNAVLKISAFPRPNMKKVKAAVKSRNEEYTITSRSDFEESFTAGYVGYYEANGCIIMGQFGDGKADQRAFDMAQEFYPDKTIIQITTDGLANGGGTIHCATQQHIS